MNCSTSLSIPTLGRSGIMWATTLKPASFARWKDSHTARTVWPLQESQSSHEFCQNKRPAGKLHTPSDQLLLHYVCFLICICPFIPSLTHWPVGVSGHIFEDTLDADLQPGAAVAQHVTEVSLQAVVRPRLNSDSHTLGVTALRVPEEGNSHFRWALFLLTLCILQRIIQLLLIIICSFKLDYLVRALTQCWRALYMLGSFSNINLPAGSLHGSLSKHLTLTSH